MAQAKFEVYARNTVSGDRQYHCSKCDDDGEDDLRAKWLGQLNGCVGGVQASDWTLEAKGFSPPPEETPWCTAPAEE